MTSRPDGDAAPTPSRRPGGRTARVRAQALAAAGALLEEDVWPITAAAVAQRAGISDVTIYRRWGSVEALLLEAAVADIDERLPIVVTGDLDADVRAWAHAAAASIQTGGLRLIRLMIEIQLRHGADPALGITELNRRRFDLLQESAARTPGAPPLDPVLLYDGILAPIYLRVLFGYAPVDVDTLVDRALAENARSLNTETRIGTGTAQG